MAGRGWQPVDLAEDADDEGVERRWYVAGEPPQVLLGVDRAGEPLLVARPRVTWESWRPLLRPDAPHRLDWLGDVAGVLRSVSLARRRTFRWCRYCRTLAAPEHRHEPDICSSCAEVVLGVVH